MIDGHLHHSQNLYNKADASANGGSGDISEHKFLNNYPNTIFQKFRLSPRCHESGSSSLFS
ncbi:unnamed protein product [Sphenostylis stenocarpa]|uniref:Uncharacterized protein n=1 Tax=Sphenostylis stenocarpa TaxID=92480 RepID=A0AA86SL48_9FABA|nr:unnamed protein product [Sphenostylis stenocarpa]